MLHAHPHETPDPAPVPRPASTPAPAASRELPAFGAEAWAGGAFRHFDPASCRGRWLALLFYPRDFTTDAAELVRRFACAEAQLSAVDCELVGLNRDSAATHRTWVETTPELSDVSFLLAEDEDDSLRWLLESTFTHARAGSLEAADAADEDERSACVIVDPDGRIRTRLVAAPGDLMPADVLSALENAGARAEHASDVGAHAAPAGAAHEIGGGSC